MYFRNHFSLEPFWYKVILSSTYFDVLTISKAHKVLDYNCIYSVIFNITFKVNTGILKSASLQICD